ncbi:diguanylate cyclase [Ferrovibrio sp.]|uniref:GGDEF domain-containing protein n=1 Tax=Ferrovibrio sp. TaxID=1917215 RepID=UPI0035B4A28A
MRGLMYGEDMQRAAENAHAAVASMAKYALPPIPVHYTVWYEYHIARNGALVSAVDALIDKGEVAPQAVQDIYAKHFTTERRNNQQEMAERLERAIDQVRKLLGSAESNTRAYGDSLERFSDELGDAAGQGEVAGGLEQTSTDITSLIGSILEETRDMQQRNSALESKLAETNAEVAQLRESFEQVRREAMTDMLTGLANRKSFADALHRMTAMARDGGTPLSLLMLDIDHFKRFNDIHGHQTGDTVLQLVGRMLADNTKGQDIAARYGGEEFAVLLPMTGLEQAEGLAETIRRSIAGRKLVKRSSGEDIGRIGISVGVAQFNPGESLEEFVLRADKALYVAKSAGRGRVVADRRHQS